MLTFDGDLPRTYDPNCGCDGCVTEDPMADWFAGVWAELLAGDPRDEQATYEGLTPCATARAR